MIGEEGAPPPGIIEASRIGYERNRERKPKVRCPLVNPFCPDDLCVLEANHPGSAEGWHVLGTYAWDDPHQLIYEGSVMFMYAVGEGGTVTDRALMNAGADRADELWPEYNY